MTLDYRTVSNPLTVKKRIQETPDAVSLVFEIPSTLQTRYQFAPGQFVTLFLQINGEVLPRSYSIPSSPLVDPQLMITVKRVTGGRGSNFLMDQVKVGDAIAVGYPAGNFFRPPPFLGPGQFVFLAAGSGITPIFSILQTILASPVAHHALLIYGSRNQTSIIYNRLLEKLQVNSDGRLTVHHILSQPDADWSGPQGRVSEAIVQNLLAKTQSNPLPKEVYICGPQGFMATALSAVQALAIADGRIHQESFTSVTEQKAVSDAPAGRIFIGPDRTGGSPQKISALISGETVEVDAQPDQTILESLLKAGANPPYSCLEGSCMACLGKVREGRVYQDDPGILSDDNFAQGDTLTCQSRPASPMVKIDFDSL